MFYVDWCCIIKYNRTVLHCTESSTEEVHYIIHLLYKVLYIKYEYYVICKFSREGRRADRRASSRRMSLLDRMRGSPGAHSSPFTSTDMNGAICPHTKIV